MHVRVKSSQIWSLSYDAAEEVLRVKFNCSKCKGETNPDCQKCSGLGTQGEYEYGGVGAKTYAEIRDADSVGSAFHRLIKSKPKEFPFKRLK